MKLKEVDINKLSPMMQHYVKVKEQYQGIIIFYRLGDFYEMFFEDAIEVSHALELTLTGRNAGLDEKVPMCGVPYHAKDIYIDKLVKKGYKVAICEQVEDPKNASGIVKREITEVISIGTITSTSSLNEKENSYIASIYETGEEVVISYVDITTGELFSKTILNNLDKIINEILFLQIKEIIITSTFNNKLTLKAKYLEDISITIIDNLYDQKDYEYLYKEVTNNNIIKSINHLLYYLIVVQKRKLTHFTHVKVIENKRYLNMDFQTKRNLELTESLRQKERKYSLLWLLDETKTAMGSRRLKKYIEMPLTDVELINKRLDTVTKLMEEFILCDELREYLYGVYDLERLCGKLALGTCNGKDMVLLRSSLELLPKINKILEIIGYETFDDVSTLYEYLNKSLYDDPPSTLKEGYLIKTGFNKSLDELKDMRSGGKNFISNFEQSERLKTGIKNLKVGYNKVFGYYIEISKGNTALVKEEYGYERKQTLANSERYINNILKEKEALVLSAEEKIITIEYELFNEVKEYTKNYIDVLLNVARVISEIDVLQGFAKVSEKYNYTRPVFNNQNNIEILSSRHPVVERVIKDEYVANDIIMDKNTDIILITGPNMAGKSTYMRQLGIIVIMAQIGCFVPCHKAGLIVFDSIYTRIGASDDLVSGKSTFMVEMLEASNAIKNATKNSLILFDELGRGTATFDGMSLAQAILEYIATNVKCKTIFSTHYHELTALEKKIKNLSNYHVSCTEEDGNVTFLHKVGKGAIDKSYGINVAKLADLPPFVIERASEILKEYENKNQRKEKNIQTTLPLNFQENKSEVEEELKNINVLDITPIKALNILYELKTKIK